jgi:hypothetical protein
LLYRYKGEKEMTMPKFDIPEIPWDLVDGMKRKMRKFWALEDLDLQDPAMVLSWKREGTTYSPG